MIEPIKSREHQPPRIDAFFAPPTSDTLFWRPRFMANTPVMQHAAFLFWLVGALRPRSVAVCGASDGVALFAICQAMDKLNITGRCMSIGFLSDGSDTQSGVPTALRQHAARLYDDILHWRKERSARDVLGAVAPSSLDLLFINSSDFPNGESHSIDEWRSLVSQGGVIVISGDPSMLGAYDGRSAISFAGDCPLTVLTQSDGLSTRLRTLLDASDHGIPGGDIGLLFRRLGQGHLAVAQQIDSEKRERELSLSLDALRGDRDDAMSALHELREAYEGRNRILSQLQEELLERDTLLESFEPQLTEAQQQANRLSAELETAESEYNRMLSDAKLGAEATAQFKIISLKQELDKARQAVAAGKMDLERERQTRFSETAALTRHTEALRNTSKEAEASYAAKLLQAQQATAQLKKTHEASERAKEEGFAKLRQEIGHLKAQNAASSKRVDELAKRVADLMNSTSWRISAPIRWVKDLFVRHPN